MGGENPMPRTSQAHRSHGEGSISQRKDGRWQAALMVAGRRQTVYGRTRQEVPDKLRHIQGTAQQQGQLPTPGRLTLIDYLQQWLDQATPRLRAKTHLDYEILTRLHVAPFIGNTPLSKLTPLNLTRLYATLQREGR